MLPALIVALVYVPALGAGFVWIDWSEIVDGVMIVPLEKLGAVFLESEAASGYHRPIYRVLHTVDRAIWGLDPMGYHLSSVMLHAVNVLLVAVLARRWGLGTLAALALAGLWGLHPVNSAVAGLIHAKADLAVTTCMLGSGLAFEHRRWFVSGGLVVIGLFTKETAFLLPVAVTLFYLSRRHTLERERRRDLQRYMTIAWSAALVVGAVHLRATADSPLMEPAAGLPDRLLTWIPVYLDYLRLLFVPIELGMSDTVTRFSALPFAAQAGAIAGFLLVASMQVWIARRVPSLGRWIVLYHLALLPVAQIVPTLHFRADRYLYLPSLALVGLLVEAASLAVAAWPRRQRLAQATAVLLAAL